jgi:hypothetical protein
VDFSVRVELLITCSAFVRYWRKKMNVQRDVQQLSVDFSVRHDSCKSKKLSRA